MLLASSQRYIESAVRADLSANKMVFIGGPRQVGKTTFSLGFLDPPEEENPAYLNWDVPMARPALMKGVIPNAPLLVLDEIHKYARWRNLVKGLYDKHRSRMRFIITGSARLDYYRRGGDSLQGRYHYHRLHPFSVGEFGATRESVEHLLRFGGFPEPCLAGNERTLRRWQRERMSRVLSEDLRELERVKEVSLIELMLDALPERVGSPLSIKSLAEDLGVAFATCERWISILERLYVCYRIEPYGPPKLRAVKKERKLYFWDWAEVRDPGARFENMVASQLLKFCHAREDAEGYRMELRFLRDVDRREIDFVVLQDKTPLFAVECKSGERAASNHNTYFRARTSIPEFYQVHLGGNDHGIAATDTRVLPFHRFCADLQLP